jgi:hypothetical protein
LLFLLLLLLSADDSFSCLTDVAQLVLPLLLLLLYCFCTAVAQLLLSWCWCCCFPMLLRVPQLLLRGLYNNLHSTVTSSCSCEPLSLGCTFGVSCAVLRLLLHLLLLLSDAVACTSAAGLIRSLLVDPASPFLLIAHSVRELRIF